MDNLITKAELVLKGQPIPGVRSHDFEEALMKYADGQRRDGESGPAAFVRLLNERDDTVTKLSRALDALRVAESLPNAEREAAKADLHATAGELMDDHVEKSRRDGESVEQATARLARDRDPTFTDLFTKLRRL